MSIGLNRSYQHVGLNRLGAYLQTTKEKGPELADKSVGATIADRSVGATIADRNVCATIDKPNEIWRRITGIFPGVEISPKLRKRGLRNLARRLEERMERARENVTAGQEVRLSFADDFKIPHDAWTRVQTSGMSIEAVCVELGCTRERLTLLLKEYCGLSAGEFFDALNFSSLKRHLVARMRAAAQELWGWPGSFAAVKLMNGGLAQSRKGAKNSKYFCSRFEEMFEETRGEERARRVGELCEMLRVGTGGQATSGTRFDLESWAISAGYASGANLKRACLNVCGRTLAQIEKLLAAEVVQFYLCAEDRELRAIACSDRLSVEVARARELYHGDEAKPVPPYEDEWAKFEELKTEWLARMWKEFG